MRRKQWGDHRRMKVLVSREINNFFARFIGDQTSRNSISNIVSDYYCCTWGGAFFHSDTVRKHLEKSERSASNGKSRVFFATIKCFLFQRPDETYNTASLAKSIHEILSIVGIRVLRISKPKDGPFTYIDIFLSGYKRRFDLVFGEEERLA